MALARRVRVSGLVQGVFFRAWTREHADQLNVAGWVRNCPDGSLEAKLEGEGEAVRQLIEHMRNGPGGARVDDLQVEDAEVDGLASFEVRR